MCGSPKDNVTHPLRLWHLPNYRWMNPCLAPTHSTWHQISGMSEVVSYCCDHLSFVEVLLIVMVLCFIYRKTYPLVPRVKKALTKLPRGGYNVSMTLKKLYL